MCIEILRVQRSSPRWRLSALAHIWCGLVLKRLHGVCHSCVCVSPSSSFAQSDRSTAARLETGTRSRCGTKLGAEAATKTRETFTSSELCPCTPSHANQLPPCSPPLSRPDGQPHLFSDQFLVRAAVATASHTTQTPTPTLTHCRAPLATAPARNSTPLAATSSGCLICVLSHAPLRPPPLLLLP